MDHINFALTFKVTYEIFVKTKDYYEDGNKWKNISSNQLPTYAKCGEKEFTLPEFFVNSTTHFLENTLLSRNFSQRNVCVKFCSTIEKKNEFTKIYQDLYQSVLKIIKTM